MKKFHKQTNNNNEQSAERVKSGTRPRPHDHLHQKRAQWSLGHHAGLEVRQKFHFLYHSNLEVFHLPGFGCLLGHTCHSFKCRALRSTFLHKIKEGFTNAGI